MCNKSTDNVCPKTLIVTNKEIKGKSRCADCMPIKSFFDKVNDKSEQDNIVSQFLIN